jgi:Regulator of chromosome condensation (RCC1) repeat
MRYYSLFARSGGLAGRARRLTAVTAVLAVGGVFAGMVPAQAAHADALHWPLAFLPSRVVYGSVPAGQARDRRFFLVNLGWASTGRLTFTITGPGASGFTLSRNHCAAVNLPPGGSCWGMVRFAPGQAARYRAQLTARGRKRTGSGTVTATLPLTGTGTAPHLVFIPPAYDYGEVPAGQSATKTFTLSNDGTAATGAITISTTGDTAAFPVTAGPCHGRDLAPGHHCTLTIGFRPATAASYAAQVNAAAPAGDHATVPLTGTGTPAPLQPVSAGGLHTCTVKTDHTLWCWGSNFYGQLGDATTTNRTVPVQVGGHASDWASVAAGASHTCAVKTDHTLWCWGLNGDGEFGDGTTTNSLVPVQVGGHASDWAAVAAGALHTCAVKTDGTLWCWGDNTFGQLGDGSMTNSLVPVQVSGQATDWAVVTAGEFHTCAARTDHTLWCWGWNPDGQLGNGSTTGSPVPVQVSGM